MLAVGAQLRDAPAFFLELRHLSDELVDFASQPRGAAPLGFDGGRDKREILLVTVGRLGRGRGWVGGRGRLASTEGADRRGRGLLQIVQPLREFLDRLSNVLRSAFGGPILPRCQHLFFSLLATILNGQG